jgi:hypothetical protein
VPAEIPTTHSLAGSPTYPYSSRSQSCASTICQPSRTKLLSCGGSRDDPAVSFSRPPLRVSSEQHRYDCAVIRPCAARGMSESVLKSVPDRAGADLGLIRGAYPQIQLDHPPVHSLHQMPRNRDSEANVAYHPICSSRQYVRPISARNLYPTRRIRCLRLRIYVRHVQLQQESLAIPHHHRNRDGFPCRSTYLISLVLPSSRGLPVVNYRRYIEFGLHRHSVARPLRPKKG